MKTPEIREDYVHNRTVIIAPSRRKRPHGDQPEQAPPHVHKGDCPLEPELVNALPAKNAPLTVGNKKNWDIKVIKNIFPVVSHDNPKAYGDQEVVIETPDHDIELSELPIPHIAKLLWAYGQRIKGLSADKRLKYILIFKNFGGRAGASLDHSHSQIFATDFLPPHILDKLTRAEQYKITKGSCYYCDLIAKERKGPRWIGHDSHVVAFTPYASSYNYEAWIMPRRHRDNIASLSQAEYLSMAKQLRHILRRLDTINLPYNFYLHQVIDYPDEHLYLRIAPRRQVWAGVELGSRLIVNNVSPEEAATFYRGKPSKKKTPRR